MATYREMCPFVWSEPECFTFNSEKRMRVFLFGEVTAMKSDTSNQEEQAGNPWHVNNFARKPRLTNFELRRDPYAEKVDAPGAQPARRWWQWRDRNLHLSALMLGAVVGVGVGLVQGGYVVVRPARTSAPVPIAHVAPAACLAAAGEES